MSESSGIEEQVKDPGRRKFFKHVGRVATAGVGGAVLGRMYFSEVDKLENGIITESGIFFPLYEKHSKGIEVELIPHGLDVFFLEGVPHPDNLKYFLQHTNEYLDKGKEVRIFPNKHLAFLSQEETEIMLGDVEVGGNIHRHDRIITIEAVIGAGLAGGLFLTRRHKEDSKGITRRKFLRAVMLAGAAWGMSSLPSTIDGQEPYNENVIDRIYSRYVALDNHLHPELSLIFFRNIIMADKMLTVSEDIKKRTGKKARIAFRVGSGHAGIEDFLQAGQGFCRGLILAYPKSYLRSEMELNNGIKKFCTSRLVRLPENLSEEDMVDKKSLDLALDSITERRVVDEKLVEALTAKLA